MDKTTEQIIIDCFCRRLGMTPEEISDEDTIASLIGDEHYLLSHILLDVHENLLSTITYLPNEEFGKFDSIGDVVAYFIEKKIA